MGLCEEICASAMPLVSLRSKTTWETDRSGSTESLQGEFKKASLRSWYLS